MPAVGRRQIIWGLFAILKRLEFILKKIGKNILRGCWKKSWLEPWPIKGVKVSSHEPDNIFGFFVGCQSRPYEPGMLVFDNQDIKFEYVKDVILCNDGKISQDSVVWAAWFTWGM